MARGDAWSSGGAASASSRSALFGSAGGVLAQRRGDVEDRDIEAELDGMYDRVARLRRVVGDIDEETRNQRTLVESLEATVLQAQAALRETLRKMNRTYSSGGGGYHMVYLALFCFGMLLFMYLFARGYRFLKWLF